MFSSEAMQKMTNKMSALVRYRTNLHLLSLHSLGFSAYA
jgi:hypothetical protein